MLTCQTPPLPGRPSYAGGRLRQNGGRLQIGMLDGIRSEWWAPSDQNAWTASLGIRTASWRRAIFPRRASRILPVWRASEGKWYHTGLWPHEGVDFTGLRVGVIGTGSSGVQSIPIIARQAKHLYVFQRTANFSLPARNMPMPPDKERAHKAEYPARRRAAFDTPFGIAGSPAAREVRARSDRGRAATRLRGEVGRGRQYQLSLFVHGLAGQQGVKRHRIGVCSPEDPHHGQGFQDGRTAVPQQPSDRHQAAYPRYRLLRDVQSRQRHLGRYPKQANPGNHADRVAHRRCRVRARRDRLCDRF